MKRKKKIKIILLVSIGLLLAILAFCPSNGQNDSKKIPPELNTEQAAPAPAP
ncbi:MAG: hypothetical protein PHR36_02775 [Patescibacteria group bacterium]|nr:hypothetical protein [Patescibacteria group bacterium]